MAERRFTRYPINLRLRLKFASGELETTTDEVSLAGFSAPCPNLPEVGTSFGFVVHLPDGGMVAGTAAAMRIGEGGLAGFSCEFEPSEFPLWEAFLAQEQANGGVWRMIGRYALNGGEEKEAARSVLEKGPLGILFRKIGETKPDEPAAEAPVVMRLHMVGENGEAYRLAFEKHPSDKPDESPTVASNPKMLELARKAVSRILRQDVFLRRTPNAPIFSARLVEFVKGGYGYFTQQASLMGLQGSELIVIEADGKGVFPSFSAEELELIAHDTFRREPTAEVKPSSELREGRAPAYEHKLVHSQRTRTATQTELIDAMEASVRVQTRVYGSRSMRLFPDLWVEVLRPGAWVGSVRGFAMEDGTSLCVFVLTGPNAPRVVRLEPSDQLTFIGSREG